MKVSKDFDLSTFNSYNIKSHCAIAYFPETENDFKQLFLDLKGKEFVLIGNGNNIILSKSYYNIPFIILNGCFNKLTLNANLVEAEAGVTMIQLTEFALLNELTNAEFLHDIPSSVGGAVVMNAGTKEGETKNILHKVRYLDLSDLEIKEKLNHEINLSYRDSFFQNNKETIILKVWFKLQKGNPELIKIAMQESKNRRWAAQPREYPNCGSVFKRPPNRFVGPMLDELHLRGFCVGGAQVSTKHSGFIVNKGSATGTDILNLIKEIQLRVREKFNISLEVEQRVI